MLVRSLLDCRGKRRRDEQRMQWGLSLTSQSQRDYRLLFNRIPKCCLSICTIVFGAFVISACQDSYYKNEKVAEREVDFSVGIEESKLSEYIIVLEENIIIADAINDLQKFDAKIIKNLKRGRYLIELKNDPGIELLKKHIEGSKRIKQIQPNFSYTIQ